MSTDIPDGIDRFGHGFWAHVRGGAVAYAALATVLVALLSWGSFIKDLRNLMGPVLLVGVVVVGVGIALRAARLSRPLVVLLQLIVAELMLGLLLVHNPLPLNASGRQHLLFVLNRAYDEAARFGGSMNVHDGIAPYVVTGGVVAVLLADVLAVSLRRAPLAGLVVLGIFSVPFSLVGNGISWVVFALTAACYLLMLRLQQSERLNRWGRALDDSTAAGIAASGVGATARPTVGPVVIGVVATALAVVVPALVPSVHLDLSGFGSGSDDELHVQDPTVGMYESLKQRSDRVYVTATPIDGAVRRAPHYLRIAVLKAFDGQKWTADDRHFPKGSSGYATFAPPESDPGMLGPAVTYRFHADERFDAPWLPTFVWTQSIQAGGNWKYDDSTLDFMGADDDTNVSDQNWTATSAPFEPSQEQLLNAPMLSAGVPSGSVALPPTCSRAVSTDCMPPTIERIAEQRTKAYDTPFEKAVALQNWFRGGDFRYSLKRPVAFDARQMSAFLTTDKVGYCQQFASAMAVLAREVGIPARVAVGFLNGELNSDGAWDFRGRDLHAWPELWFNGVGWVAFEPTPAAANTDAPSYTDGALDRQPTDTGPVAVPSGGATGGPQSHGPRPTPEEHGNASPSTDGAHTTWVIAGSAAGVVLIGAVLVLPGLVRRRRRSVRLVGDPEQLWSELRDTVIDLRLTWPPGRSPREAAATLQRSLVDLEDARVLERVVRAVEESRYSPRAGSVDETLADGVRHVVAALEAQSAPRVRRAAKLWPRSVLRGRPSPAAGESRAAEERELVG